MKNEFAYHTFLLLAILVIKVSAFHIHEEHHPDDTAHHCELCLLAIEGLQVEGIQPVSVAVPNPPITTLLKPARIFVSRAHDLKGETYHLFSRPPPSFRV